MPDELIVAISAPNLCRTAKIKAIAYLSVFRVEETSQSPGRPGRSRPRRVPVPDRARGVSFIDVRDMTGVAVLEIQRRVRRGSTRSGIYEVVAEDVLTGETGPERGSEALGRPIKYVGDDLDQWIQSLRAYAPQLDGL